MSNSLTRIGRCTPTVILVRHADVDGGGDPPLNEDGVARADELRHVLGDAGIDTIFVTHFQRSRLTATPLATQLAITPTTLDVAADVVGAIRALPSSSTALVVGHTSTVPEIIAGMGGPAGETIASTDFDRLFVLSPRRLSRLRYGA